MKRLTCKDVSGMISRQHDQPLKRGEKFWLTLHLCICNGCRNFLNNTRVMRAALRRYLDQGRDQ